MKAPSLMWRSLFSLYRKLRRISYKAKKRSAWIALRRNRICRFATRRRRKILLRRILFSRVRKMLELDSRTNVRYNISEIDCEKEWGRV